MTSRTSPPPPCLAPPSPPPLFSRPLIPTNPPPPAPSHSEPPPPPLAPCMPRPAARDRDPGRPRAAAPSLCIDGGTRAPRWGDADARDGGTRTQRGLAGYEAGSRSRHRKNRNRFSFQTHLPARTQPGRADGHSDGQTPGPARGRTGGLSESTILNVSSE